MVTRELIKHEIDRVEDQYLEFLYRIIKALGPVPEQDSSHRHKPSSEQSWEAFVNATYGMFADDPIERGEQGEFEVRETLE